MPLSAHERRLVEDARSATLATVDPSERPRLVPICFVLVGDDIWSPLDEKPKTAADPRRLARVRDILVRPAVTILVDRWSEDWTELGWVRLGGHAALVEPPDVPAAVITLLRAKYPQYADHDLEHRPVLRIAITANTSWWAAGVATDGRPSVGREP